MINTVFIKEVIDTWQKDISQKKIIKRDEADFLEKHLSYKHILAISGIRRSGKTYLMFQLIQELLKKHPNNVCYINFEDERFSDEVEQLDLIYKTFLEYKNPKGRIYFFLDEIQNIKKWEKWLSRMYEKGIKFFISGSNSSLLSSQFSKSLTGRHKLLELYPLSFYQFIFFKQKKLLTGSFYEINKTAKFRRYLEQYLKFGGLPEVIYENKKDVLKDYFKDILIRDIIARENVKYKQSLKEIALILLTNTARYHSLYSLNKILKARSINTIKNYLSYLENSYLIFKIPYFTFSLKKQLSNPFKIYAIDTGMRNAISLSFSKDKGWLYENIVAIELLRSFEKENIFYWKNIKQQEVDFIVRVGIKIKQLIQVCYQFEEKTRDREIKALISASRALKCNNLLIITSETEGEMRVQRKKIKLLPLWKWLLVKN